MKMVSRSLVLRCLAVALPLGAAALLANERSIAQTCTHDCPVAARDAHGCCPAVRPPPPTTTVRPPPTTTIARPTTTAASCPAGFVFIPGGTFMMGAPSTEGDADEHPQHAVTVAPFCMSKLEVTVSQYQACVTAGMCIATKTESRCNASDASRTNHPINCINFSMALAYCNWTSGRLPTEEEWEYAARGTDGRRYPWGNSAPSPQLLNACGDECVTYASGIGETKTALFSGSDGYTETSPVGSYPRGASPFGVLDMAGNVYEWTSSPYCTYPTHNCQSNYRMYRGGGWYSSGGVTVTTRNGNNANDARVVVGIRCAK